MKQTAVEFLNEQIRLNSKFKENSKGGISFKIGLSKIDELFKQAIEIEREQSDDYAIEFAKFISNEDYDLDYWVNNSDIKTLLEIFKKIRYANNKI